MLDTSSMVLKNLEVWIRRNGLDAKTFEQLTKFVRPFSGTVYRSTAIKYAKPGFVVSGVGSQKTGARWNPIGIKAVYGSFTPDTAMAETLAYFRYYGLPIHTAMPRTFVAIAINLERVLDLTDTAVQRTAKYSTDDFVRLDWRREIEAGRDPITQTIGKLAFDAELEGLIVASAAAAGEQNIVCFADNVNRSSSISVLSADKL